MAMADGVVTKACYNGGYGNCVIIDHRKWCQHIICTWNKYFSKNQ